ncbi:MULTISPECIES: DUF6406 domain-containing protein [unclassified Streptomyces]|uniref:DUF6406 domain-containing protein n=1 Tax=unclassified Streptomyces TaxID=2593676 RepID=UPI002E177D79|nr:MULTISPECIES: DUF6406 domain-containing protein [unclassified Streptomyces]
MNVDKIGLWHGIQQNRENASYSVMDIYRDADQSVRVKLGISVNGEAHQPALRVGETFPVGDETWKLAELTGWPSEDDWLVVLHRVTSTPPA